METEKMAESKESISNFKKRKRRAEEKQAFGWEASGEALWGVWLSWKEKWVEFGGWNTLC